MGSGRRSRGQPLRRLLSHQIVGPGDGGSWAHTTALLVSGRLVVLARESGMADMTPGPFSLWTAREAGGHLHLPALCAHGREAHGLHPGGQEPEEDGRGRPLRYVQSFWLPLGGSSESVSAGAPARTPSMHTHREGSPNSCGSWGQDQVAEV